MPADDKQPPRHLLSNKNLSIYTYIQEKTRRTRASLGFSFSCGRQRRNCCSWCTTDHSKHAQLNSKKCVPYWLCNYASSPRFLRGRPRCLCPPLLLAVLLDDRLLHSSETFHEHVSRARKIDPYVPLPEEALSVGETYPSSLELQCRALPAASNQTQRKTSRDVPIEGSEGGEGETFESVQFRLPERQTARCSFPSPHQAWSHIGMAGANTN